MRFRPDIFLFAGLLIFMSGCAGNQWNEKLVEGSNGPVKEIVVGRRPSVPIHIVQAGAVPNPQGRVMELQDHLLKAVAMLPPVDFTDYKVGPEDALEITFFGMGNPGAASTGSAVSAGNGLSNTAPGDVVGGNTDQLSGVFQVNHQGEIRLMLVGNVKVAGLTPIEIAEKLTELYKDEGYLVDPQITVSVAQYRHSEVAVSGAVKTPGYYPLIGPRPLLAVLGMAGGLVDKAGDTVNIIRPRPGASKTASRQGLDAQTFVVNLDSLLLRGDTNLDIPIKNGDVVFVPFAQSAYVIGAVTKPGNVLLQDNMTLTKAISMCKGKNITLASNYVTILRVGADGKREVIPVDLSQVLKGEETDPLLRPNDIVYVHESKVRRFFYDFKLMMPSNFGAYAPL